MKKNILVQVGERAETRIRTVTAQYNEMGELIAEAYDETYTVTVPVMEARNVEMTPEEIAEMDEAEAWLNRRFGGKLDLRENQKVLWNTG